MKITTKSLVLVVFVIGIIFSIIVTQFIFFEPITDKLEATCNEYGMSYEYRNGQNCLDKNNTLHPIISKCPSPYERGLCEIRFVNIQN